MVDDIIQALDVAKELICKKAKDTIQTVIALNGGRHYLIKTGCGMIYYLLYKRNFFMTFGKTFNKTGIGESINNNYLIWAKENNVSNIMVVYSSGYVYVCPPTEWLNYAKTNNTIRTQFGGETTCSIPVTLLRRWK